MPRSGEHTPPMNGYELEHYLRARAVIGFARGTATAGFGTSRGMRWRGPRPTHPLEDGASIAGASAWTVINTPGHTDDSVAFWHNDSHTLLSGDAVITARGAARAVHVFAHAASALPPFSRPLAADFHAGGELQGGSVSFVLPNLAPGDYVVTAVADTRGDFAAALPKFAVNSVCPGWVRTDMGGANATRSVEEGADGIVWLAAEAPQNLTGKFLQDRKVIPW